MPKLLLINCTSNWGSTGKIAEQIGVKAMEHGWDVYVAYGRYSNPSQLKTIKIGKPWTPYIHYIEDLLFDNEGLSSRWATKRFLKKVDEIQPDIVHLHNIHDHFINYKLLFTYLAKKNIPVVWTQHDQWATTGHCYYNLVGCERWKDECHDCPLSKWYALDRSRRNFQWKKSLLSAIPSLTIVPVSKWLGENMRQSHLKNRPIEVIHNGIDIQTFSPQVVDVRLRYGITADKKIVLGVAALWDKRKGLADFVQLAKQLPKAEYAVVIVGKLAEEIAVAEDCCQMVFVDRTQNALELAQLYSAASVFVNPTYQDNYPTTNLEAIACGTPVITYRTGGSPESVDEDTGMVVEQGDILGLQEAVLRLATEDCQERCRKKAIEEFDNKTCFNPYISLYNKKLENSGGVKTLVLGISNIWCKNKGLDDFLSLSRNPDFIVMLVGLSDEQVALFKTEEYKDCHLVPICRTQNQQELAMLYSMADVTLSLSYFETFGLTIAESLSCGTPVIVYNNTGQATLPTRDTGKIVETGDIGTVVDFIRLMKNSPFSEIACRKRAEENFDKDKCFEMYVALYESLLKKVNN